jgi:hypothetical protein
MEESCRTYCRRGHAPERQLHVLACGGRSRESEITCRLMMAITGTWKADGDRGEIGGKLGGSGARWRSV